jgi:hypothetical protein
MLSQLGYDVAEKGGHFICRLVGFEHHFFAAVQAVFAQVV